MIAAAMALAAAAGPAPLTCGAATRPGVAELGEDGVWRGRAVDLCRAVAKQVGGPGARIAFHDYDGPVDLRASANDGIAFLSPAELAIPMLRAGPVAAVGRQILLVKAASPLRRADELAGRLVCFIVGTRAEDALNAWASETRTPIERLGFQEPLEMQDAFDVGKCAAQAVDAADPLSGGDTRMLGPPLAATPIVAATPAALGDRWRAVVASVVARLSAGEPEDGGHRRS